jgi:ABC-2 type transport system permease protein
MAEHTYRAEWTKLRTLRSTWTTVGGAAVLAVALGAVVASQQVGDWDGMTAAQRADIDPTASSLIGVLFTTVILGSLAVRAVTSEYSTGMIRLSFSAMPHRRRVIVSKAVIVAGLALSSALLANLVAFLVGQGILSSVDASTTLGAPGVARSIVFGALAVTATTILGVGLGAVLRRTAAATTVLAMAIIGTQMFSEILPEGARRLLPGVALQATVTGEPSPDLLAPFPALLTLGGYAAAALLVATVVVSRRDV